MTINRATWMSTPSIQAKTLKQIVLPGTHDSGTANLQDKLSSVIYNDIAILWDITQGPAPVVGKYPWENINSLTGQPYIYVGNPPGGPIANAMVMQIARGSAKTQAGNIGQQLSDGIRYFDLRVCWEASLNSFYVQHALLGDSLTTILGDIKAFLQANPGSKELIFLDISHANFSDQATMELLCTTLTQNLPASLFYTGLGSTADIYDTTLSDITGGSAKIIVLNTDKTTYPYPVNNCGFLNSNRDAEGVDTVDALKSAEFTGLENNFNGKELYKVAWTLTAQVQDVVNGIMQYVVSMQPSYIILPLATSANQALPQFIADNYADYPFNLVTVDWYAMGNDVVGTILQLNGLS